MEKIIKNTLLFLLFSCSAYAQEESTKELIESVVTVTETLAQIKEAGVVQLPCTPQVVLSSHFNLNGVKDCNQFLKDDGSIGPWGVNIINTIAKLPPSELEQSFFSDSIPDMDFICPKFNQFSPALKLKFWVWTFSAISWQESSCNPKTSAQGTNARAVGLLQLEDTRGLRKSRGPNCDVSSVTDVKNNLACGVDILHQQLLGAKGTYFKGVGTGELFWKSSYWQHLRLKDSSPRKQQLLTQKIMGQEPSKKTNIKELVMRFPYCQ